MSGNRPTGMYFDDMNLVGTTITSEKGDPLQISEAGKARLASERELDAEIQNLLHHYMRAFLADVKTRHPALSDKLGFIGFVFRPEIVVNVTNMQDRSYVRALVKKIAKAWEEQDAAANVPTQP
jgi:hypothetical protein